MLKRLLEINPSGERLDWVLQVPAYARALRDARY